jgi:hypothetical protein
MYRGSTLLFACHKADTSPFNVLCFSHERIFYRKMDVFTRKKVDPEWAHRTGSGAARTRNPDAEV